MATRLTVLGSSAAVPANGRNLSAQLLEVDGHSLLFDCGEATQFQLRRFKLHLLKIEYIFISHLHGDHFFGLPGLISTMNMMGRTNTLTIFSPPGLEAVIAPLLNLSNMKLQFQVNFKSVDIFEKTNLITTEFYKVSAFPILHSVKAFGYICNICSNKLNISKAFLKDKTDIPREWFSRIKNGEDYIDGRGNIFKNSDITTKPSKVKSFAYCTDTGFYEPIAEYVKGVDLLYHEATYLNKEEENAILRTHSTAKQAGIIAKKAGAKRLLLGHFSGRYRDVSMFESEAKEVFRNEVILAIDGMQITI